MNYLPGWCDYPRKIISFYCISAKCNLKKRRKRLPVIRKSVPLQADYYLIRISI
ncbi:hypothetical protein BACEGG_00037 [Bacteroides eggerthii DSM 20697]|nr:hypothetical protein BACEGG_00037 [Bacteroides eggerthii DSM 20697]